MSDTRYDLAVVGAGILGLSCALAAARRGLKVIVIDRSLRAQGASVRNFGLVTVTGQERNTIWPLTRRSRDIWNDVAHEAKIPIIQQGAWFAAQRPEAAGVLEAFVKTDMAQATASAGACELLTASTARQRCPQLQTAGLQAVMWSPHELRVESREAIPRLAQWLHEVHGVEFWWETAVHEVQDAAGVHVVTSRGTVHADATTVCPGDDFTSLFSAQIRTRQLSRCTLQMLRLESPGFTLPGTVMSDLSLARYGGFTALPETAALSERLRNEQPEYVRNGIHLIVAQSADGSLVVGDSHHYDAAPGLFSDAQIDELILAEYQKVMGSRAPAVRERWIGTYTVAHERSLLVEPVGARTRLVMVTSGVGASCGFALGDQVVTELFG